MKLFLSMVIYINDDSVHCNILPCHDVEGNLFSNDEIYKMLMKREHHVIPKKANLITLNGKTIKKLAIDLFKKLDIAMNIQLKYYYFIHEKQVIKTSYE